MKKESDMNVKIMVKPYYPERGLDIKELLENSIRIYMESEVKKLCRQHS